MHQKDKKPYLLNTNIYTHVQKTVNYHETSVYNIKMLTMLFILDRPRSVAPQITSLDRVAAKYWTDAILVCNVTGNPTPTVKWYYQVCTSQRQLSICIIRPEHSATNRQMILSDLCISTPTFKSQYQVCTTQHHTNNHIWSIHSNIK